MQKFKKHTFGVIEKLRKLFYPDIDPVFSLLHFDKVDKLPDILDHIRKFGYIRIRNKEKICNMSH